jgi:uncharacterized membrane protein YphA (DoxX/SURF4 family)
MSGVEVAVMSMPSREAADQQHSRNEVTRQPPLHDIPDSPADTLSQRSGPQWKQRGERIERRTIELASRWFEPAGRIAIFVIYFWFGFMKIINLSPATPLAEALVQRTIGMQYFNISFKALAVYECILGVLFLIPALTRICVVLIVIHMGIVCSPLIIAADVAWTHPLVPTMEGQYIIKNVAIIVLAAGILVHRRSSRVREALGHSPAV